VYLKKEVACTFCSTVHACLINISRHILRMAIEKVLIISGNDACASSIFNQMLPGGKEVFLSFFALVFKW
jgi:hypothetical protein